MRDGRVGGWNLTLRVWIKGQWQDLELLSEADARRKYQITLLYELSLTKWQIMEYFLPSR